MTTAPSNAQYIYGTSDGELINGTSDNNVIFSYAGNDIVFGFDGRDFISGGDGDDRLFGQAGDDFLEGGAGADFIDGGAGRDSVNYHNSYAGVTIDLAGGFASGGHGTGDTFSSIELARGSSFDDVLYGNAADNFLCGLGGNDSVFGGDGDDILRGAQGADYIDGGAGNDTATYWSSDAGVNVNLHTGTGLWGAAQGDVLVSVETVKGSHHDDVLRTNDAGATLYGYYGDDILTGRAGVDILTGGSGNDSIKGGSGDDQLFGESGADTLVGDGGDDLMTAGEGNDVITGGAGADQFKFRAGDGVDVVTDFEAGIDNIVFSDGVTTWRDIVVTTAGNDMRIAYGADDMLTIQNATAAEVWGALDFY